MPLILLAVLACLAPLGITACGSDGEPQQPRTLYVNRTLTANGFAIHIGHVTFAPVYSWVTGGSVEHGQAIVVSMKILNIVGPHSDEYAHDSMYLLHPAGSKGPWKSRHLPIGDYIHPGGTKTLDVVFPLDGSSSVEDLQDFGIGMHGREYALDHEAIVFFNGANAPDGTPLPLPVDLRLQGTLGLEIKRAELRTDYPCLHRQAKVDQNVIHIAATITVPQTAPEDPEEVKRLFYGLEAYDEVGRKLEVLSERCPPEPEALVVKRPMVQDNIIFDIPMARSPQPYNVSLRFAGAEGNIEIPASLP